MRRLGCGRAGRRGHRGGLAVLHDDVLQVQAAFFGQDQARVKVAQCDLVQVELQGLALRVDAVQGQRAPFQEIGAVEFVDRMKMVDREIAAIVHGGFRRGRDGDVALGAEPDACEFDVQIVGEIRPGKSRVELAHIDLPLGRERLRDERSGKFQLATFAGACGKIEQRLAAGRVVEIPEFQAEVRERQRRGLAVAPVFDLQRMPVERNLAESDAPRTAVTGVRCRFGRRR